MDGFDPQNPPLGWIEVPKRTQAQNDLHEATTRGLPRLSLPPVDLPKGTMVVLPNFFKRPEVVADLGFVFNGYGQYSGSCVGVSNGNAAATVGAVQRCIADKPQKAFLTFWLWNYGRGRYKAGIRGQGEGSIVSASVAQDQEEGFIDFLNTGNLPQPTIRDERGVWFTKGLEMQYSNGANFGSAAYLDLARPKAGMSKAVIQDISGVRSSIVNGYPVNNGCDYYAGGGSIASGGGTPYAKTSYTGRGGHATNFVGVWHHPNDGYLYLYWNQWPNNTYPVDPAAGVRCSAWMAEAEAAKLFRYGGDNGETLAVSNIPSFPVQPKVIDNFA